jgi:hypothetical protein
VLSRCPDRMDGRRSTITERRADPRDQRAVLVAPTAAGADYLHSHCRAGAGALAYLISELPPDETAALVATTPALRHLHELENEQQAVGHQGSAQRETLFADRPRG